jgi:hypothetical protein
MGTKCPMSPSSSCLIEPRSSHCPFVLSHTTITPFSTPFPMQTTHHPPTPHTILTNQVSPISSPYQSPTLRVNVKPQTNIFPIPLNDAHVGPFSSSILLALIVDRDQTPQPTPIFSTCLKPPCEELLHTFTTKICTHNKNPVGSGTTM